MVRDRYCNLYDRYSAEEKAAVVGRVDGGGLLSNLIAGPTVTV